MPDSSLQTPPNGDPNQAEKYIDQLVKLVDEDKLTITHTDLSKFDPSALQDHYSLELKDYKIEVSHSKYPQTGKDSYVILFTNVKQVTEGSAEKVILAFMHLDITQFSRLRNSFSQQEEKIRRKIEEQRLKDALAPIDEELAKLISASDKNDHPLSATNELDNSSHFMAES